MSEKKTDIMSHILGGNSGEFAAPVEELNCLIYKADPSDDDEISQGDGKKIWQATKDNVSVNVWEGKAKIKVKVSHGERYISMKRIARIAANAIAEELKKEV